MSPLELPQERDRLYAPMIDSLHISGFKLFRDITLPKLGRMNLFVGENNTGKSCLLEAIGLYAGLNPIVDLLQTAALRSGEPLRPWEVDGWNEEGTALRHPLFELFHLAASGEGNIDSSTFLIGKVGDSSPLRVEYHLLEVTIDKDGSRRYNPARQGEVVFGAMERALFVFRGDKQIAQFNRQAPFLTSPWNDPEGTPLSRPPFIPHLPAAGFPDWRAASFWDALIQGPGQKLVLDWLRLVDPRIEDLDYIAGKQNSRVALLKLEGQGRIPLRSMGDGVRRMFHIGLAMAMASKGILLIDEFENGLHWRVQRELWAALGRAAQEFDVQIFATTHSRDCIDGFVTASKESSVPDAKMYRLEREGDEIYAVNLSLINVEDALEVNGEVR